MAITVNLYYTGRNGAARRFAEEMISSGTVADIRAEEGNLRYEYFLPIEDPETVLLIDSWRDPVSTEQIPIYNVTFEPGCRNNWHIHHAKKGGGQMLICVGGRGYYQEWGKEPVEMVPGTVINIPAEVKHWHGAAHDSWFSHLAVELQGEAVGNEWCEPVSDKEYSRLKE